MARKTRSHKVWIAADTFDYDFFTQRASPTAAPLAAYDPDFTICRDGFRQSFGGLGLKPFGPAKRYLITIEEITA